jgi:hypothetical protein
METINKISETRIEVVTTTESKQEFEKETLEAQKKSLLDEIAKIDLLLSNFVK